MVISNLFNFLEPIITIEGKGIPKSACSSAHQIFLKGFKSGDWEGWPSKL